jgi:hypothetical protein
MRRIDVDEDGYRRTLEYGLIYTTLLTVPKPGPYQVRVACMDDATGKMGTGGVFVSIPLTKGTGLRLSGIVFQHDLGEDDHVVPAAGPGVYAPGQSAPFSFQIASNGPKPQIDRLAMRTRLFRDGVEVWHGEATPVVAEQLKSEGYFAKGSISVPKVSAGQYLLRVDIEGKDTPDTPAAWQWARLRVR